VKNFRGRSPTYGVREVVIADEEKDRDAVGGQATDALGKLPLLGLARLTTLIGITAEEDEVYAILQGIVYHLVKGSQEIKKA